MFQYNCLNPIAACGLDLFDDQYKKVEDMQDADAVLVRSASMHDLELPANLKAVARAGAGVNNIPLDKCAEQGIVVFNTPGANANGVKEAVVTALLLASRDYIGGYNWVQANADDPAIAKAVEKQKKAYAGTEIQGKTIGVIGLGAIGVLVANVAEKLGMTVYGYDPYISVDAAWSLSRSVHHAKDVSEIYANCDYITLHVPMLDSTKGMLNADAFAQMKDGVKVLNFSRDALVVDDDIKAALASGKVSKYVTDFPNPAVVGVDNVITIPHLGASTAESEDNCAVMAVKEIRDYLENGNIKNSVNYPACDMGVCKTAARIAVCHKNIPNTIAQFTGIIGANNVNISDIMNKSRGEYAYSLIDCDSVPSEEIVKALSEAEGVFKVRVIC
ncbi:MAG: phosphoglycerate dehydrogenase [Lachnospiraceae bacterium]